MLTEEQKKLRTGKLTASQIGILVRGNEEQLIDLWRCVSGDPAWEEPDFSNNFPVQLGIVTEKINLDWFQKKYGTVSRRGEVVTHENGWGACTLDGWSDEYDCPLEAKQSIQYKDINDIIDFYSPQLHWQGFVSGRKRMGISVIIGALEPDVNFIAYDEAYGAALYKRAEQFMQHVWNLTPPVALPELADPVRPEAMRTVDMVGNNSWSTTAVDWLQNKEGAKKFEEAKKTIKEMMAPDVGTAHGHGITAKRAKDGSVRIKEGEPKK